MSFSCNKTNENYNKVALCIDSNKEKKSREKLDHVTYTTLNKKYHLESNKCIPYPGEKCYEVTITIHKVTLSGNPPYDSYTITSNSTAYPINLKLYKDDGDSILHNVYYFSQNVVSNGDMLLDY